MLGEREKRKVQKILQRIERYASPHSTLFLRKRGDAYACKIENPFLGTVGFSTTSPCVFYEVVSRITKREYRYKTRVYDKDKVFWEAWEKCLRQLGLWLT
jgi:hypothetical protein